MHFWLLYKKGEAMIQLYLLSIVFNGLTGFLLMMGELGETKTVESSIKFSPFGGGFRLILGILTTLTGMLKLLSPVEKMPILGDFLPAVAGIAAGFILIFSFYREHSTKIDKDGKLDRIGDFLLQYKKVAGISLLVISGLHFFFARAFFL